MTIKEKEILVLGLNLKIGNKEINLSTDEAKKLKNALDEIFGKEIIKEHIHHHDWFTYPNKWNPGPITYGTSKFATEYTLTNASTNKAFVNMTIK